MGIMDCHFYIFLLVTQISYSLQESNIHKNVNIRRQGLLGHPEGWLQPPYPSAANIVLTRSRHLMYVCYKNEQKVRAEVNLELSGLVTSVLKSSLQSPAKCSFLTLQDLLYDPAYYVLSFPVHTTISPSPDQPVTNPHEGLSRKEMHCWDMSLILGKLCRQRLV